MASLATIPTWNDSYLPQVKNRNPQYMSSLYNHANPYLKKMLSTARIFDPTSEDLLHNVWNIFFAKIEKFEGRSQVRTFLGGILINCIREHRLQQKRLHLDSDPEACVLSGSSLAGWWQQAPKNPEEILENNQLLKMIEGGLNTLSDLERQVFVLREVQGIETDEICKNIGISVSHVGVLIFRAKKKLMVYLRAEGLH